MPLHQCEPRDWRAVQSARADFIVNAIRQTIPPGSLWHEKRFALAQLESLVIASPGGLYSVDTFDATDSKFSSRDSIQVLGDLAVRVSHIAGTHELLTHSDIERIIETSNAEFETQLALERASMTTSFRRVTCTVDFNSPMDDVQKHARSLFDVVAAKLGYSPTFHPYVVSELWLRQGLEVSHEDARSAAEFVFISPLPVEKVTQHIQTAVGSLQTLSAPGIHGILPGMSNVYGLHFVGRRF